MQEYYNIFNKYVKKYDLTNINIMNKFHHTYRVVEYSKKIATSLSLNDSDIELASIIGLLHDIARFEQWTKYQTFVDSNSTDHGDLAYEILTTNNFIDCFSKDDEVKSIILKAVKYHNKIKIGPDLTEREKLFANIVRDADKIDIMIEQCNNITEKEIVLKDEILESIYNKELVKNNLVANDVDSNLRMLSWVFDFNYVKTFEILKEKDIFNKKIKLLEMYGQTEKTKELTDYISKIVERKLKKC